MAQRGGGVRADPVAVEQFGRVCGQGVGEPSVQVVDFGGQLEDAAGQQGEGVGGGRRGVAGCVGLELGAAADHGGVAQFGQGVAQLRVGADEHGLELVDRLGA